MPSLDTPMSSEGASGASGDHTNSPRGDFDAVTEGELYEFSLDDRHQTATELCLKACCDILGFDIAEMWTFVGELDSKMGRSSSPLCLQMVTRPMDIESYMTFKTGIWSAEVKEERHSLSPILVNKAITEGRTQWYTSQSHNTPLHDKLPLNTAIALPLSLDVVRKDVVVVFFSTKDVIRNSENWMFLLSMSKAAAIAHLRVFPTPPLASIHSGDHDDDTHEHEHDTEHDLETSPPNRLERIVSEGGLTDEDHDQSLHSALEASLRALSTSGGSGGGPVEDGVIAAAADKAAAAVAGVVSPPPPPPPPLPPKTPVSASSSSSAPSSISDSGLPPPVPSSSTGPPPTTPTTTTTTTTTTTAPASAPAVPATAPATPAAQHVKGVSENFNAGIPATSSLVSSSTVPTYQPGANITGGIRNPRVDIKWDELSSVEFLVNGSRCTIYTAVFEGEPVMVKLLNKGVSDADMVRSELELEAHLLMRLNHPNVVKLVGCGTNPERFNLLERLDGGTLAQRFGNSLALRDRRRRFTNKRPLTYIEILSAAKDIAAGLQYMHEDAMPNRCVLHRDLKPDNIAFDSAGTIKLIDLGLAKAIPQSVRDRDVFEMTGETGSLRYMAPEVFQKKPYNRKADVYSFSMVLWEMATTEKPYLDFDRNMIVTLSLTGHVRPPCKKKWPPKFTALLQSCWDPDPNLRPSFKEIGEQLTEMSIEAELASEHMHPAGVHSHPLRRSLFSKLFGSRKKEKAGPSTSGGGSGGGNGTGSNSGSAPHSARQSPDPGKRGGR